MIQKKSAGGPIHFTFRFLHPESRKLEKGESIAVNGVCLTVTDFSSKHFEADVVRQTLEATTLGNLKPGESVNIERALRYGDLMGGHFVTGHVDARGKIKKIEKKGRNLLFHFEMPKSIQPFAAKKGSIVVDGISLTLQEVSGKIFKIAVIPHTHKYTTLGKKKAGDEVNLEVDLVARYLKRLEKFSDPLRKKSNKTITVASLQRKGF